MAYLMNRIKEQLAKEGYKPGSQRARDWLKNKVKQLAPNRQSLLKDKQKLRDSTIIGKMYFYFYDPKTKEKLKYYDRFPLVIPIEEYPDGFLGLNLHYINPKQRLILLDKLSEYANNSKYDKTTKLRLSYDLLSRASKIFETTPCIKRYLFSQIQSRFIEIDADEWDIAALLPVENFVGASTSKVWSDSRKNF